MTLPREVRGSRRSRTWGHASCCVTPGEPCPQEERGVGGMPSLARSQAGRGWVTLA